MAIHIGQQQFGAIFKQVVGQVEFIGLQSLAACFVKAPRLEVFASLGNQRISGLLVGSCWPGGRRSPAGSERDFARRGGFVKAGWLPLSCHLTDVRLRCFALGNRLICEFVIRPSRSRRAAGQLREEAGGRSLAFAECQLGVLRQLSRLLRQLLRLKDITSLECGLRRSHQPINAHSRGVFQ